MPDIHPAPAPTPLAEAAPDWSTRYEPGVPSTIDVPAIPLAQLLSDAARAYARQTALHMVLRYTPFGRAFESRMSFARLDHASDRFAAGLQRIGVRKGDRVAIMLPNLPQSVIAFFGILRAGAIIVNTNPTYTPRELLHQLQDSGAETLITLSGYVEKIAQIKDQTALKHIVVADIADTLPWPAAWLAKIGLRTSGVMRDVAPAPGIHRFAELLAGRGALAPVDVQPDDVALLQYSGGTTGRAKAAMLTNANIVANVCQIDAWFHTAQHGHEKVLGAIPFFHVYGMTVAMLYSLRTGAELIVTPDPRDTSLILQIIERERVTLYPGVPAMYIGIINHPRVHDYDLRSIKACLSGGAALPVEVSQQFEQITGGRLVEGFGMTECSPVAIANPINGWSKPGAIGVPIPNTDIVIVALDADASGVYPRLPRGQAGELLIRGPQVMKGYWNQPEETALALDADGWLHTGDIATIDADGFCAIVDRKKDLIIASGYNIVPREVEEVLFMCPKVQEAVVVGVPDPKRGEAVKAFVVLKEGQQASAEELIAFCRTNLAPYKVPKLIEFRDDLPKSQIGKVLRRKLQEPGPAASAVGDQPSA